MANSLAVSFFATTNTTLTTVDHFLQLCLLPTIIVFGVIGNISNIYIFTRPALHRTCSIYFLASAVNGLILLLFGTTSRWLGHSFPELDATQYSLFFCRFRNYLMNIIYVLAPYFLACVTVDRFCSSSADVRIRRWSTRPQIAYAVVIIITLITFIAYIHMLIFYTISDSSCQPESGFYPRFFPFFATVYYFTAVLIIIIFGVGTIYNVRAQRKRIQPMTIRANHLDRRRIRNDSQLLVLLLVRVACYACFAMPYYITLMVAAVEPSMTNNLTFLFLEQLAIMGLSLSQAVS
jgi:hypothetical protein